MEELPALSSGRERKHTELCVSEKKKKTITTVSINARLHRGTRCLACVRMHINKYINDVYYLFLRACRQRRRCLDKKTNSKQVLRREQLANEEEKRERKEGT